MCSFCCHTSAQPQDDRELYVSNDYMISSQRWTRQDVYNSGNMYTKDTFFTNLRLPVQLDGTNTQ